MLLWQFQLFRLVPLLIVFAYAAYSDYKTGFVANWVWFYAPVGAVLTLVEVYLFSSTLILFTVAVMAVVAAFGFCLFYVCDFLEEKVFKRGLGLFGGADSKALITLALCMPVSPVFCFVVGLFPLVAFVVGLLLAVVVGLVRFGRRGLFMRGRLLPYLFAGMLIVLV